MSPPHKGVRAEFPGERCRKVASWDEPVHLGRRWRSRCPQRTNSKKGASRSSPASGFKPASRNLRCLSKASRPGGLEERVGKLRRTACLMVFQHFHFWCWPNPGSAEACPKPWNKTLSERFPTTSQTPHWVKCEFWAQICVWGSFLHPYGKC